MPPRGCPDPRVRSLRQQRHVAISGRGVADRRDQSGQRLRLLHPGPRRQRHRPGAESAPISVFLPGPPTAPSKIAAIPGDGSAEVAITPGPDGVVPGSGPGLPILNYEYSLNGGATPITRTPPRPSALTITGLANGTEVSIMVRAVNLMGPGPWSAAVKVTPGCRARPRSRASRRRLDSWPSPSSRAAARWCPPTTSTRWTAARPGTPSAPRRPRRRCRSAA